MIQLGELLTEVPTLVNACSLAYKMRQQGDYDAD